MPGDKDGPVEERFLRKLEKLVSGGNISGARMVAQSLQDIYRKKIASIDTISADPAVLERRAAMALKMGDVHRLLMDHAEALKYYNDSLSLSPMGRNAVQTYLMIGEVYKEQGRWKESIPIYESGRDVSRTIGHIDGMADNIRGLGYVYWRLGDFTRCRKEYETCLRMLEGSEDRVLRAKTLLDLGAVLGEENEREGSKRVLEEAVAILESTDDKMQKVRAYHNLGFTLVEAGEYDMAKNVIDKMIRLAKQMGDRQWEAWGYSNLSLCLSGSREPRKALEFSKKALGILEEMDDGVGLSGVHASFGAAYSAVGDLENTKAAFEKAIEYARKMNMTSILAMSYLEYARSLKGMDSALTIKMARTALGMYKNMGLPKKMEQCRALLKDIGT